MTQVLSYQNQNLIIQFEHRLGPDEFLDFCTKNPELNLELEPDGTLSIMSPLSMLSGDIEAEFIAALKNYQHLHGGKAYSSAAGYKLPDGSIRCPDASYCTDNQLKDIPPSAFLKFVEIVPLFVVEVRSSSDRLKKLQRKMTDTWIANGVKLAWLIDVRKKRVFVYRKNGSIDVVEGFESELTGENILPEFRFDLRLLQI